MTLAGKKGWKTEDCGVWESLYIVCEQLMTPKVNASEGNTDDIIFLHSLYDSF